MRMLRHLRPPRRAGWLAVVVAATLAGQAGSAVAQDSGTGASPLPDPPPALLTLASAVDGALRARPAVDAARAGQAAADARVDEAKAGRFPKVSGGERVTNGNNPVFVFGSLLEQGRFGIANLELESLKNPSPVTNFRSQLDVVAPIYDQRQTGSRIAQARLGREIADAGLDGVEQRLRFEVVTAYYGVLVATAALDVADEAVRAGEADYRRVRDRVDAGLVVESDALAVDVQLAEFRQQQIEARGALVSARAALATALGTPDATPPPLATMLPDRSFEPPALEALLQALPDRHPELRQAGLEARARSEGLRSAEGEFLPRVDAFASAGNSSHTLVGGSGDYAVGISVTYTIFDAGRRPRIEAARAARALAEAERDERANAARLGVTRAYQDFLAARERLDVTARAIRQAEEVLRVVRDRYQTGLTTVTEVLRSETALVRARLNHLSVRYAHTVGYARLLLASGTLTDVAALAP